ncbi:MAG: hypothetical protein LBP22_03845 [Deltaproteobacteria bacterium]|jgi:hypothetical protein|nr:hypothetical protein [Deltaproteobacteria bacterium]
MTTPKLKARPYQKVSVKSPPPALRAKPVLSAKTGKGTKPGLTAEHNDLSQPEIEQANDQARQKRLFVALAR